MMTHVQERSEQRSTFPSSINYSTFRVSLDYNEEVHRLMSPTYLELHNAIYFIIEVKKISSKDVNVL